MSEELHLAAQQMVRIVQETPAELEVEDAAPHVEPRRGTRECNLVHEASRPYGRVVPHG